MSVAEKVNSEIIQTEKKEIQPQETKGLKSVKINRNSSMLSIFQLKEHIGLREYLAIPNNGLNKKFVYLEGTLIKSDMRMNKILGEMENFSLLGAIVTGSHEPYYFKMTGPSKLVCLSTVMLTELKSLS